jgi:hypothetical protein
MKNLRISSKITINTILLFLGIMAGLIVIYKAATLSFTHDESGTYLMLHQHTLWQIFTQESAWRSANNHILNTLLYKLSIRLFGQGDFAMRLPNVLAYWACLSVALWVINKKLINTISKFVLFVILFLNPYVLDFYSVCRGYGLSMFFHFTFLIFIWHFKDKKSIPVLYFAFFLLSLASLSLLTNLILFPVYTITLWLICFAEQPSRNLKIHLVLAPFITGIVTLSIVAKPISYLVKYKEFEFGVASIWDSIKSIIQRSFSSLPKEDFLWALDFLTIFLLLIIIYVLYHSFKEKKNRFFTISFITLIILLHILCFGLGILFPTERKTTLYIPLLALLFSTHLFRYKVAEHRKASANALAFLGCVFLLVFNKKDRTIEWDYDRKTKDFMLQIQDKANNKPVVVLTEWYFTPTAEYYLKTLGLKNIVLLPYSKNFDLSSKPNMVICKTKQMLQNNEYVLLDSDVDLGLYYRKKGGF